MTNKSHRPSLPVPKCVFCDGSGLNGEHLWPDWIGKLIQKTGHDPRAEVLWAVSASEVTLVEEQRRHGHTTTKKIKAACKKCNSTWMSGIENKAKPLLTSMILGQTIALSRDDQRTLAEWLALKTMIADSANRKESATTYSERNRFKEERYIPDVMQIWAFHCGIPPWDWLVDRFATTLVTAPPDPSLPQPPRNTQSLTFGVGQALFYVQHSNATDLKITFKPAIAVQLWPIINDTVIWPPPHRATADDAEVLSRNLVNLARRNATPPP